MFLQATSHEFGKTMQEIVTTILLVAMSFTGIPAIETYEAEVEEPLSVQELVSHYADEFGVNKELAHYVAFNESSYNPNAIGDMDITCPLDGKPVRARGVFQLTDCWYGHIPDEDAFHAETNIKIGIEVIAKGRTTCMSQFTTCRNYYNNL